MKFKQFYIFSRLLELPFLLNEVKTSTLQNRTDAERVRKAVEEVKTRPPKLTEEDGITTYEYNFKSQPSVEFKRHWGFVAVDEGNNVKGLWCDCRDYQYRLWAPFVKKKVMTWKIPKKYEKRMPFEHSHAATIFTNPNNQLWVCKHLYSLVEVYINN